MPLLCIEPQLGKPKGTIQKSKFDKDIEKIKELFIIPEINHDEDSIEITEQLQNIRKLKECVEILNTAEAKEKYNEFIEQKIILLNDYKRSIEEGWISMPQEIIKGTEYEHKQYQKILNQEIDLTLNTLNELKALKSRNN